MSKITEILKRINDHAPAMVDIPARNGENYRCKAVLVKKAYPTVELVFPPNSWEESNLSLGSECTLSIEHDGRDVITSYSIHYTKLYDIAGVDHW